MRTGIVVCARAQSSRVPGKVFKRVNGKTFIHHLLSRLLKTDIPIVLAVPNRDAAQFEEILVEMGFGDYDGITPDTRITLFAGEPDDPLARMAQAARLYNFTTIVRVCADKIFVDPKEIKKYVEVFTQSDIDYLYSSQFVPGTGFEVISRGALESATVRYKNVEHISYAIRMVTDKIIDLPRKDLPEHHSVRLLIDYQEDVHVIRRVIRACGTDGSTEDVIKFMLKNSGLCRSNRLPGITIYTCAYNAAQWIEKCMKSVAKQRGFRTYEYILIDDYSTDDTYKLMNEFAQYRHNVTVIRNPKNLGLASSSNIALSRARGPRIIRLDADDYFVKITALQQLTYAMTANDCDVIYPAFYYGSRSIVKNGNTFNNVGGALFDTKAINMLKFMDGLRGYEGLEFFERAKDRLRIKYLGVPLYFYTQHEDSMSKTNLEERASLKQKIVSGAIHQ